MGAPTEYYVDPSIAGNSGSGTDIDPYGDLQYALDQVGTSPGRDATNGDRFNIKAGTDEVLTATLSLATYGTPANDAPLVIQGYTSAAGDGGIGGVDGGGSYGLMASTNYLAVVDMHVHNAGAADIIALGQGGTAINCEVNNTTGDGITAGQNARVMGCHVHDVGTYGIYCSAQGAIAYGNYIANGTKDVSVAIGLSFSAFAVSNIISIDGTSDGIDLLGDGAAAIGNSILSNGGTGAGIAHSTIRYNRLIINNLIEGFSGTGGGGIDFSSDDENWAAYASNGFYDNDTDELNKVAGEYYYEDDNEALSASPFAKSGSDTFANRYAYFAPVDTDNVIGGAYQ